MKILLFLGTSAVRRLYASYIKCEIDEAMRFGHRRWRPECLRDVLLPTNVVHRMHG